MRSEPNFGNPIGNVLAMQRPKSLPTMLFACISSTSLFHQPMLLSRPPGYFTTKTLLPSQQHPTQQELVSRGLPQGQLSVEEQAWKGFGLQLGYMCQ
jgi:hypothetical protein